MTDPASTAANAETIPETAPVTGPAPRAACEDTSTTRRVAVVASYVCYASDVIELPEGRTWADVASHGLKYDRWFVTYHDGAEDEFPFHYEIDTGAIDTKRPDFEVYAALEDGSPNYDASLEVG